MLPACNAGHAASTSSNAYKKATCAQTREKLKAECQLYARRIKEDLDA